MLDPNPDEMNADPQPCLKLLLLWWWLSLELLLGRRGLTPMALVTRHRHQHCREKNPPSTFLQLKRLERIYGKKKKLRKDKNKTKNIFIVI
jgi:hypothetical protein